MGLGEEPSALITQRYMFGALSYFLALEDAPGSSYTFIAPAPESAMSPRTLIPFFGQQY